MHPKKFYALSGSIIFFLLCSITTTAQARSVTGLTTDWAPHYSSQIEDNGALSVVAKEAFKRAGHTADINFISWNRALKNVESGEDDFVLGAYYNDERAAKFLISDPIYYIDVGLVGLNTLELSEMQSLRDLEPYVIGVNLGYANTPEFDQADFLNKEPAPSPTLNIRKLYRNRVDMIAGAFDIIRYEANNQDFNLQSLKFIQPPLESSALHILVSRNVVDGEVLLEGFNTALAEMKADGTIANILKKYLNR